ncbi:hypothetical protein D9757_014698 [Collybiopsis confluens]|uniref:Uncharacterized protein n=1 Tax=Collybiopsis confluens TaxID=2823264 RepID=A0A8H5CCV6_9AGAR|nr:hypothetical protein D9757_014698 [Collybiopsis confluens]
MPNRILIDPDLIPCPEFDSPLYTALRNALIADPGSPNITTVEEATEKLREQWEEDIRAQKEKYQEQLEGDRRAAEEEQEQEEEARRKKEEEQQLRDLEIAKEKEKKRAPIFDFVKGSTIDELPQRLHPYAEKKMKERAFVELWYFTPEASKEARSRRRMVETNRYEISTDGGDAGGTSAITILGTHSTRPSPNAMADEELSWGQIHLAKTPYLNALSLGNLPPGHKVMWAEFYAKMETHPELQEEDGLLTMGLYHAEMRRAWFERNELGRPFDVATISEKILQRCKEKVFNKQRREILNGTSRCCHCMCNQVTDN